MMKFRPLINWTSNTYDRLSRHYDLFARVFFAIGEKGKRRIVNELRIGNILDVACGSGTLLAAAVEKGLQPFGTDLSWGMLMETRKKVPTAILVQASFYALPFSPGAFDTVIETNAVSGEDIVSDIVLLEMIRVCGSDGEVRIADYAKSPKDNLWIRFMAWIGVLFGDYPHDYVAAFHRLGFDPYVEYLGIDGMYQYIRVEIKE